MRLRYNGRRSDRDAACGRGRRAPDIQVGDVHHAVGVGVSRAPQQRKKPRQPRLPLPLQRVGPVVVDPTIAARRLMLHLLEEKKLASTALVATACPAAIGAQRAAWERGLTVGQDLSICAVNIEPPAEFFCPSITGLNMPDLADVLERCFDWFYSSKHWNGSQLMEPTDSSLFNGESTGKPPLRK